MNIELERTIESYPFQSLIETTEPEENPWVDWSIDKWQQYIIDNPDESYGFSYRIEY